MSTLITRRELIKIAASAIIAAPAIIRATDAYAQLLALKLAASAGAAPIVGFPGQIGNPVGFAAAPGYPGSLNSSPPTLTSGNTYSFLDFVGSIDIVNLSNVTLNGCRFQSNANQGVSQTILNSHNITLNYCSYTPLTTLATAPPNAAWPCAGAGTGLNYDSTGASAFLIPQTNGYQNGVAFADGTSGPISWNFCDFWGFGNAAIQWGSTTQQMAVQDCWTHDATNPAGPFINPEHTDGIGYVLGGAAPQNIKIDHTVIAAMGSTNGIANQGFSGSGYQNISITNGYYCGFGRLIDICHGLPSGQAGSSTFVTFTGNTISSDIPWGVSPTQGSQDTTIRTTNNNLWRLNKFLAVTGGVNWWNTAPPFNLPVVNGQFLWPDSSWNNTDYTG